MSGFYMELNLQYFISVDAIFNEQDTLVGQYVAKPVI